MQILHRGAEAVLYMDEYDGQRVLVKERVKKGYRISQIDERLRRERTNHEVKLLTDARSVGVDTPRILHVDGASSKIIMEFIDGEKLKDFLEHASKSEVELNCQKMGSSIGRLHSAGIVHGDLTTSNMILQRDSGEESGKIFFVDFGLGGHSKRAEDKGVDLKLLHDAIKAAHYKILKLCWRNILIGYRKEYKGADEVIKKIEEIEGRSRYSERSKREGYSRSDKIGKPKRVE